MASAGCDGEQAFDIQCIDVPRDQDFNIRVHDVVAAIKQHNARFVFLPSPNNPTGNLVSAEDINVGYRN